MANVSDTRTYLRAEFKKIVGFDQAKRIIWETLRKMTTPAANDVSPERGHVIIMGNPGTGKTKLAAIWATVLFKMGLVDRAYNKGENYVKLSSLFRGNVGQSGDAAQALIDKARGTVLVLDECHDIAKKEDIVNAKGGGEEIYEKIFQELEGGDTDRLAPAERVTFVLLGYAEGSPNMHDLYKMNAGLARRIPTAIKLADYTTVQLCVIFLKDLRDRRMPMRDATAGAFRRIHSSLCDKKDRIDASAPDYFRTHNAAFCAFWLDAVLAIKVAEYHRGHPRVVGAYRTLFHGSGPRDPLDKFLSLPPCEPCGTGVREPLFSVAADEVVQALDDLTKTILERAR